MRFLALLLLFATFARSAHALEWKERTLNFTTAPFQATQEAVFKFTNTGSKPVAIIDLETNCDCLEASADQKIYAPGASGIIKASFHIGDRLGLYERRIKVVTDEGAEPVRLLVRIEVPEIVSITPRSVAWKINEAPVEKSVEVQTVKGVAITFTDVQPTSGAFHARLETIEVGRRYRVYLTPPSTSEAANAAVRILGRDKSGQAFVVSTYGNVR